MAELALFHNPGRSGKKRKTKRPVRAKRAKRAKRSLTALQKKYFGTKSQRTAVMAKKKRKTHRRNPLTVAANPKRRRLSARTKRRSVRRRRNPIGIGKFNLNTFMKHTLMPSAVGAAGALGLDVLLSYLPLPLALKTPALKPVVRLAGAVAVGMLAGAVMGRKTGEQVTAGAVTVILYDTLKGFLQTTMPAVPLNGLDDDYAAMGYAGAGSSAGIGEYVDGMGTYVSGLGVYDKVSSL